MPHIIVNPCPGRYRVGYDKLADNQCWPWRGSCDPAGYGQVFNRRLGRHDKAHRVVWERETGKRAPNRATGLELHHTCYNRWCVNPKHLQVVTVSENRLLRRPCRPKPLKPICHGTLSAYATRGCRCTVCREAWAAYYRRRRAAQSL